MKSYKKNRNLSLYIGEKLLYKTQIFLPQIKINIIKLTQMYYNKDMHNI